jgi:RimJ/RimL family protein N-acetyltransferase
MFTQLETERLILRRLQEADLPDLLGYRNDPEVARYQNWETLSSARARALIEAQKHLEPGTPGSWFNFGMALKPEGRLVGDCGLQVLLHDVRQAQLGFSLMPAHQGQGLAFETVTAVLDYAFVDLDLHRVIVVTDATSARAVNLCERLGLRREGHFVKNVWAKGRWADEYLYAVLQSEWLPRRTPA